jgi:hypothetical protein
MSVPLIPCPRCRSPLPLAGANSGRFAACPACGTATRLEVYPALLRQRPNGAAPEAILMENEAGCFYHSEKRATVHCQGCGRFLCALCDIEFNGQHLCPACLEAGQRKGTLAELANQRTLYDSAALSLAAVPLLLGLCLWFVIPVTAPAAIAVALYGWGKPGSLVPRTRVRAILAIAIGLAEILGGGLLVYTKIRSS